MGCVWDLYRGHGTGRLSSLDRDLADALVHPTLVFPAEGADGAAHIHLFRDDIGTHPAVDGTHGDHCRVFGDVEVPANDGLQAVHDLGRYHDRIDG